MAPPTRRNKRGEAADDTAPLPVAKKQKTTTVTPATNSTRQPSPQRNRTVEESADAESTSTQPSNTLNNRRKSHRKKKRNETTKRRPKKTAATTPSSSPPPIGILDLPLELHQEILSYVSLRDIGHYRGVSKALEFSVQVAVPHLAAKAEKPDIKRLQDEADEYKSLDLPTDLTSSKKAMQVWIKKRGGRDDRCNCCVWTSCARLAALLYMGKTGRDEAEAAVILGANKFYCLSSIQVELDIAAVDPWYWAEIKDTFGDVDGQILIDDVKKQVAANPASSFFALAGKESHEASDKPDGTLTPWMPHPTAFPTADDSDPIVDVPFKVFTSWVAGVSHPDLVPEKPDLDHPNLLAFLGLPSLPNPVLFYYVSTELSRARVAKLINIFNNPAEDPKNIVKYLIKMAVLGDVMLL